MTTYYVGPGGSDSNDGLSWANRKLTLNGAEDIPVAANDTVYVGPGVYRETLTVDVSGSSGNPITYIGDVTGENTDGIGGHVRITGSDDDLNSDRTYCVSASAKTYRTFRGFTIDGFSTYGIYVTGGITGWIIEDCSFSNAEANSGATDGSIYLGPTVTTDGQFIVRRCLFFGVPAAVRIVQTSSTTLTNSIIENCVMFVRRYGVYFSYCGGVTVRNCTIHCQSENIYAFQAPASSITVNNCLLQSAITQFYSSPSGSIVEDYNNAIRDSRTGVTKGANSVASISLRFMSPLLVGFKYPHQFWSLTHWSPFTARTGSSPASDDYHGVTRPATNAKNSWGAIQYHNSERSVENPFGSYAAHLRFPDAGAHLMFVPVDPSVQITFEVQVYRGLDYAGTLPQMIIREPGQSDRTTVDTGSAAEYNLLSDTFTPQSTTEYVVVELRSNNTAASGSIHTDFDHFRLIS